MTLNFLREGYVVSLFTRVTWCGLPYVAYKWIELPMWYASIYKVCTVTVSMGIPALVGSIKIICTKYDYLLFSTVLFFENKKSHYLFETRQVGYSTFTLQYFWDIVYKTIYQGSVVVIFPLFLWTWLIIDTVISLTVFLLWGAETKPTWTGKMKCSLIGLKSNQYIDE